MVKVKKASQVIDSADKAYDRDKAGLKNRRGAICNLVSDYYNPDVDTNIGNYYPALRARFIKAIKSAEAEKKLNKQNKKKGKLQAKNKNGKHMSVMFRQNGQKRQAAPKAPKEVGDNYIPKVKLVLMLIKIFFIHARLFVN